MSISGPISSSSSSSGNSAEILSIVAMEGHQLNNVEQPEVGTNGDGDGTARDNQDEDEAGAGAGAGENHPYDDADNDQGYDDDDDDDIGEEDFDFPDHRNADDPFLLNLPTLMGQDDPWRNALNFEEWQLAGSIRAAFEEVDDLDMPSDYMVCQFAIVCCGSDIPQEGAIEMAMELQALRGRYGITDTFQQGCKALADLFDLFPGRFMDAGFHENEGTYAVVQDFANINYSVIDSQRKYDQCMAGLYYFMQASTCDLETIRKGSVLLMDCERIGWTMKNDFKVMKQMEEELRFYPHAPASRLYNVGTFFHALFSVAKKVLSERTRKKIEFTRRGPLREIFMVPNTQAATQRTLAALQDSLRRRYENERRFALT